MKEVKKGSQHKPATVLVGEEEVFNGSVKAAEEKVTELLKKNSNPVYLCNNETKQASVWSKGRYQKNYYKEEADYVSPAEVVPAEVSSFGK